jgi:hypothetical protein
MFGSIFLRLSLLSPQRVSKLLLDARKSNVAECDRHDQQLGRNPGKKENDRSNLAFCPYTYILNYLDRIALNMSESVDQSGASVFIGHRASWRTAGIN